jgi:hypothetical protein
MAVYEIAAATTIAVPPQQIWTVLDDFSGWPAWMPGLHNIQIEHLSAGMPCLGYRFRVRGKLVYADLEVTGYGPLERTTSFRVSFPPITGHNRCLLKPLDDGSYRIERVDSLHLPSKFVSFLDKTQRTRFERLACEFLVALKHTAEESAYNDIARTRAAG